MQDEIKNALQILREKQLLLYPTDTVWGIGCDATEPQAIKRIYELKQREESKALICLVSDFEMLKKYIGNIPTDLEKILADQNRPTTVIYSDPVGIAENLIAADRTIGIRICQHPFCNKLIRIFGKPIVSTSANISGETTPKFFDQISDKIKKGVDYIVSLHHESTSVARPSKIIKIGKDGSIETIRE